MPDGAQQARGERPAPVPPPEAAELVELLGPTLALRLIEALGGTRVHVPKPSNVKQSQLCDLVGEEPLQRLSQARGGSIMKVPLCQGWRICKYLHEGGRSHAEIARLVGVTESRVQRASYLGWTPMPTRGHKRLSPKRDERQSSLTLDT